jgi:S-adenosylmethionine decarboxylase
MFSDSTQTISGKHMICDIRGIKNDKLLGDLEGIKQVLNTICEKENYAILGVLEHRFEPQGLSIVYMLSESHISIHTFPERQYIALDIYTCREYPNNQVYNKIYDNLVEIFEATKEEPLIIDRKF